MKHFFLFVFGLLVAMPSFASTMECPQPDATHRYVVGLLRAENGWDSEKLKIYYQLYSPYNSSKPTLLLINGGPGGNAESILEGMAYLMPELPKLVNLVSFDHRGLGCTTLLSPQPSGYEPGLYSMARTSGDIEAVRKDLLGQNGKWWVYGISYGTMLGQQYATLYPNHILGITLDSAFPSTAGVTIARDQYLKLFIENDPQTNDLFKQVVDKYPEARNLFLRKMFGDTYTYKSRLKIASNLQKILNAPTQEAAQNLYDPGPDWPETGMSQSIACEEIWDYPETNSNYFMTFFEVSCILFKPFRTPMNFSNNLPTWKLRTMVWAGAFDPVTPVQAGRAIAKMVPGAFFYENPLAGHGLLGEKTACAQALLVDFIKGATNAALTPVANSASCQSAPSLDVDPAHDQIMAKIYNRMRPW